MTSKGYNVNYEEKMTNIKQLDLGDEPLYKYKTIAIVEYMFGRFMQAYDRGMLLKLNSLNVKLRNIKTPDVTYLKRF